MKVNVQAVNFDIAKQLEDFIQKKINRFERHLPADAVADIKLTVVKPATNLNKAAQVRIGNHFAEKTCDTFEEAISSCLDAIDHQLQK